MSKKRESDRFRWDERLVFEGLRSVFPEGAYVLLPQVRNQTGFSRVVRTADALAVSCWPSRGLYLTGVEIKVSVSDYKAELRDPAKSAEIQRFCRYWYVAAPAGIVPEAELPDTWGLIEVSRVVGKMTSKVVRKAPVLEADDPTMALVAAIVRCVQDVTVPRFEVDQRIADAVQRSQADRASRTEFELKDLKEAVAAFEATSGVTISRSWDAGRIGPAVKFVMESGVLQARGMMDELRKRALAIVRQADKALDEMERSAHADCS